jgi:hypothetical protein
VCTISILDRIEAKTTDFSSSISASISSEKKKILGLSVRLKVTSYEDPKSRRICNFNPY